MAKARRAERGPTRAASRPKATPIFRRTFRSSITLRRRRSRNKRQPARSYSDGRTGKHPHYRNDQRSRHRRVASGSCTQPRRAHQGFYDGVVFHRVIDGFMAQTGDPTGTGRGGSGQKLRAEFNAEPHTRGAVSMARAQSPDSGDSQFFICFDDAPFLNGKYSVWGEVTAGMENVDKIKRGEPVANPDRIV